MTKKIILYSLFIILLGFVLHSCMHDDLTSSINPSSKEYNSKSVWKEDEVYIKNVMQVYQEKEAEIKKGSGAPLWDYAMTMGSMDESFLIVPVPTAKPLFHVYKYQEMATKLNLSMTPINRILNFFRDIQPQKKESH